MPHTNVKSDWVDGNLVFYDKSGNEIATFDGTNRELSIPSGSTFANAGTAAHTGTQTFDDIKGGDASLAIDGDDPASATGGGGAVVVTGGIGGATSGLGGAVTAVGGAGTAGNAAGGVSGATGGAGQGSAAGGATHTAGGAGGATGAGGAATVTGGGGGATSGTGGAATVTAGAGSNGDAAGGVGSVADGAADGTGTGGVASLTGGASAGASGAATGGTEGSVNVQTSSGQQAAFDRLGVFAAAAFSELIRNGSTALEALKALEPTFDALAQGMEEFGLQGTETINKLLGIRKLTQDYEDQFAALDALSQIMSAFGDAGVMNLELMQTVAADVGDQFRQIAASGGDINAAMALQQPLLQQLWEAQEKYGAITDETTARLLAQAEEQGLVGAHMKDVNERILDVLIAIADVFGAVLPESMREFGGEGERQAERVGSAIDAIPDSKNVTISISQSGSVELPGGGGGSDIDYGESRHMSGIVGSARRADSGLFVIPGGLARDEVPVVAQTGEAFLSRKAVASIGGAAGVNALNDGRGSSGAAGSSDVVSAIRVLQADSTADPGGACAAVADAAHRGAGCGAARARSERGLDGAQAARATGDALGRAGLPGGAACYGGGPRAHPGWRSVSAPPRGPTRSTCARTRLCLPRSDGT